MQIFNGWDGGTPGRQEFYLGEILCRPSSMVHFPFFFILSLNINMCPRCPMPHTLRFRHFSRTLAGHLGHLHGVARLLPICRGFGGPLLLAVLALEPRPEIRGRWKHDTTHLAPVPVAGASQSSTSTFVNDRACSNFMPGIVVLMWCHRPCRFCSPLVTATFQYDLFLRHGPHVF